MRKWDLLTSALQPGGRTPLFLQLANAIAEDIRRGRLKPGDALPGTRVLAGRLGVHRNTVIAGYEELVAQGLARARGGGGTFVADQVPEPPASDASSVLRPVPLPTYAVGAPLPLTPMTPPDPGGPLMLFRAVPDVRLLPAEALSRAFRRAVSRHGRKLLGYADPRGHRSLRREIARMVSQTRGIPAAAENVVVTRGSQQALYLVGQALLSPGDVVAVEELGNPLTWRALRMPGAELVPLPIDEEGLDLDALVALLRRRRVRGRST